MVSDREVFWITGPTNLAYIDRSCKDYQRSVAASLVQGAYVLERDRQNKRRGPDACAPAWWENFHFQLKETLTDPADSSIFGAVYENKSHYDINNCADADAPKFVIAFRGTLPKKKSITRDIELNLHIIRNCLHKTLRFEVALQCVLDLAAVVGHEKIWLAGHSMGAAIAILVAKDMAKNKMGFNMKTFLFNPPFFALPSDRSNDTKVKQGIRIAATFIKAGIAAAIKGSYHPSESFTMLSSWMPNIFVNTADHICSAYIRYFENRMKMEEIGAGKVGRLAAENSLKDLFLSAFGGYSESFHLLPSANLYVNFSPSVDLKQAHGIHQWWKPNQAIQSTEYIYSPL